MAAQAIPSLDTEKIRFAGEATAALAMRQDLWLRDLIVAAQARPAPEVARIKRGLMARSLLLTQGMAPEIWAAANRAAVLLGVVEPIEIYQSAGAENAAIHMVASPVFLEVRGRLISLLDSPGSVSVFGHELGHYLAHGQGTPNCELGPVAGLALSHSGTPEHAQARASTFAMAREITADRFGLLTCQDLDAALRVEMVLTTGLATDELQWDTQAYLAQSKALIEETLKAGESARGSSHPEHGLRAWAVWLFSETALYKELTGQGPGTRTMAEIDALISKALGASPTEGITDGALAVCATCWRWCTTCTRTAAACTTRSRAAWGRACSGTRTPTAARRSPPTWPRWRRACPPGVRRSPRSWATADPAWGNCTCSPPPSRRPRWRGWTPA